MGARRLANRMIVGIPIVALLAGCVGSTSPNPTTSSAPAASAAGPASPSVSTSSPQPAASGAQPQSPGAAIPPLPSGWTGITSPWLGYTIALPPTGWVFYNHVSGSATQGAYDWWIGPKFGLNIGYWPRSTWGVTLPPLREDVTVAGVAFQLGIPDNPFGSQIDIHAMAVQGGKVWDIMGEAADITTNKESQTQFLQILSTFRFPAPGFVEPSPTPAAVSQGSRPIAMGLVPTSVEVAVGEYHICVVTTSGGVKCWGDNEDGQLGDGTTSRSSVPVDVVGLGSGVTAIAAHTRNTCALTTSGGVKCWGNNESGQLGNNTDTSSSTPVGVIGMKTGVTAISVGPFNVCALTKEGGVKCWGGNDFGQLGNGSTTGSPKPVDVSGLTTGVTAIAVAFGHTCALTTGGGVKCWGENSKGQLGKGTTTGSSVPVNVSGLTSGVTAIAVGGHACVLTISGGIKCWGENNYGELGNGTTTDSSVPVDVAGLGSGVTAIAAHYYDSCALLSDGEIKCWGDNSEGQLGRG